MECHEPMLTIREYRFVAPDEVWSRLGVAPEAFLALAREFGFLRLDVFGSVLREDFSATSDVDFVATFDPERPRPHSDEIYELEERLSALLARPVDVLTMGSVLRGDDLLRGEILDPRITVYTAG